jgi:hypothetical protein
MLRGGLWVGVARRPVRNKDAEVMSEIVRDVQQCVH